MEAKSVETHFPLYLDVDMEEEGMAFTLLTKKGHRQQVSLCSVIFA